MSHVEEKVRRWQFGIRSLLIITAIIAAVTCAYSIDSSTGFFLTIAVFAVWGGVSLRRTASDEEWQRTNGILGSLGGGAAAGMSQIILFFLRQWIIGPRYYEMEGFGLIQTLIFLCPLGAVVGGIVGALAWGFCQGLLHCISRVTHRRVLPHAHS